ncbi:MAG: hypothetical protein ACP5P1_12550 [Acidimicrobiales bacterium]
MQQPEAMMEPSAAVFLPSRAAWSSPDPTAPMDNDSQAGSHHPRPPPLNRYPKRDVGAQRRVVARHSGRRTRTEVQSGTSGEGLLVGPAAGVPLCWERHDSHPSLSSLRGALIPEGATLTRPPEWMVMNQARFPDFTPSGNAAVNPDLYDIENQAIDPDGRLLRAMQELAPWAGKTIVDLGCGTGCRRPGSAPGR